MNLSQAINRIKKDLGLYGIALPFKNVDKEIVDIIKNISLVTFSELYPKMDTMEIDLRRLKLVEQTEEYNAYIISGRNNTDIAFVEEVRPNESTVGGRFGYNPRASTSSVYGNIMGNASYNLMQHMVPSMTFHFKYPNKLFLYNELCSSVIMTYGQMHDLSLTSIPATASESFYKIMVLDAKSVFYNFIKHYNEVATAHGRIDLKIDDWADAAAKREELVEKWEDTYHLDRKTVYWA